MNGLTSLITDESINKQLELLLPQLIAVVCFVIGLKCPNKNQIRFEIPENQLFEKAVGILVSCLALRERGYRNVWTPYAELYHHESASRGAEDSPEKIARFNSEVEFMKSKWGDRLLFDPAYSPNLTLDREDFSYAFPPPRVVDGVI